MARVATAGWVSGEVTSSRLRFYHLLFMLLATVAAVGIAVPSVIGQRNLFQARATLQFDPAQFPAAVQGTQFQPATREQQNQLGGILKPTYPLLGGRQSSLTWRVASANQITVEAVAPVAEQAQSLANVAAEGLARRLYTTAGNEHLNELLSRQLWATLNGQSTTSAAAVALRQILLTSAVAQPAPQAAARTLEQLSDAERFALTRSLEVLDELKGLDLQSADRELRAAVDPAAQGAARERQRGATAAQGAVRGLQSLLYRTYHTQYDPRQPGAAYVAAPAVTTAPLPTYKLIKLLVAALVGLLGGLFTVLIDRSVGIVPAMLELWSYRAMIRNLVGRDLKARYKNSLLGYFWSLINPLMTMLIFWGVFGVLLRNNIPQFPVFLIVGLLPWNYAVMAVSSGMRAVLDNSNLVKKVYFPRAILPITAVISNLVNYLLALPIMFLVMFAFQWVATRHVQLSWTFAYLPLIILIQTIFLIGITLLLSTVAVFFRDTTHIVDIFIQLWIFITPVFFSLEIVTQGNTNAAKVVRWLNPMASLIDFYRDVLYGRAVLGETVPRPPSLPALDGVFRTLLTALVILAIGAYLFQRTSRRFGEEL